MSVKQITAGNFEAEVLACPGKVLLDFWAPWCGPCRMVGPIVEEIANEFPDITVGKVNVDEEMALAIRFQVASIPTLVVFENGVQLHTAVGYRPKQEIKTLLSL